MEYIIKYLNGVWFLFLDMAPYLMLGFLFAGILHVIMKLEVVSKYLGTNSFLSVVNASLFGVPLPLCSCGVIPTGVSLYRNGASKGAGVSFLISTPQTGVDSILVTYSLMGLPFALLRPIIAFTTGILGGFLTNKLDKSIVNEKAAPVACSYESDANIFIRIFKYAFVDFLQDIQKWLVIGILLAGLIAVVVPDNFFADYITNDFVGMLLILLFSIPLYVCATASVPIAVVLMMKGFSPGAALVFLMAGPATNIATLFVISKVFGNRSAIIYLVSIVAGALFFGTIINTFLPASWFDVAHLQQSAHHHLHGIGSWITYLSAFLLLAFMSYGFYKQYFKSNKPSVKNVQSKKITVIVEGMNCNHCKNSVTNAIMSIKGVKNVEVDLVSGKTEIFGELVDLEDVKNAVEKLGYQYKNVF
jgi:uncharacterized protein